jgi:hypothetical protein
MEIVKLMLEKGANRCEYCHKSMEYHIKND